METIKMNKSSQNNIDAAKVSGVDCGPETFTLEQDTSHDESILAREMIVAVCLAWVILDLNMAVALMHIASEVNITFLFLVTALQVIFAFSILGLVILYLDNKKMIIRPAWLEDEKHAKRENNKKLKTS